MFNKERFKKFFVVLILVLAAILFVAPSFIIKTFNGSKVEESIFYLLTDISKGNMDIFFLGVGYCLVPVVILSILFCSLVFDFSKREICLKFKDKKFKIYPIDFIKNHRWIYSCFILFIAIIYFCFSLGVFNYGVNKLEYSTLFEEEYVAAENVNLKFPKRKNNLIIIMMESMENTVFSSENGGGSYVNKSFAWELESLTLDKSNVNFSNTSKIGGAYSLPGTGWTTAGMIAQTSGIPLLVSIPYQRYNGVILPNVTTLGDILKKEGYNQELIIGSAAKFGEIGTYFKTHGNYEIFDLEKAKEVGKIPEDYFVWWGFEDKKLYDYAKERIDDLASLEQPFNVFISTIDTHFINGYLDDSCPSIFDDKYANVYNCASIMIKSFVNWLKEQPYYEDTTVVILGDHLGMQKDFYVKQIDSNYERTIYNLFINSKAHTDNVKNRKFAAMDIFPTILASIGVDIEGDRLGLGTNLFSTNDTLIEKYGYDYIESQLLKRSHYYEVKFEGR